MAERISTPKRTKEIIEANSFAFKKNFGQNFLIDSNILDNTFEQARDNANYRVVLTDDAEQQIIEDEWLGFSDECDFRQIMVDQVAQDKVYTFEANIAGLNMTLWQDYNGVLLAIAQGENSIDDVSLKSSATYYLEIDSMGAKSVNYGVLASCG